MQKCRINPALDEGCYLEVGEGTEINSSTIEDALGLLHDQPGHPVTFARLELAAQASEA